MSEYKVTDAELEVLKILWKQNPLSAAELFDQLKEPTGWNIKTLKTFLTRLTEKKIISFNQNGKSYLYYPVVEEKLIITQEKKSFLSKLFNGSVKNLVSGFIEDNELSDEDLEELQKLIESKKRGK